MSSVTPSNIVWLGNINPMSIGCGFHHLLRTD